MSGLASPPALDRLIACARYVVQKHERLSVSRTQHADAEADLTRLTEDSDVRRAATANTDRLVAAVRHDELVLDAAVNELRDVLTLAEIGALL